MAQHWQGEARHWCTLRKISSSDADMFVTLNGQPYRFSLVPEGTVRGFC